MAKNILVPKRAKCALVVFFKFIIETSVFHISPQLNGEMPIARPCPFRSGGLPGQMGIAAKFPFL